RGTLGLSAVTATAWSPSARKAALATTVLSIPPLKATAHEPSARRTSSKRSSLAASSVDTVGMVFPLPVMNHCHHKPSAVGPRASDVPPPPSPRPLAVPAKPTGRPRASPTGWQGGHKPGQGFSSITHYNLMPYRILILTVRQLHANASEKSRLVLRTELNT